MWRRNEFANRSNASDVLATKRVRPWDSCDDVKDLKRMLIEKEEELVRVTNHKDSQLAELQCKLKLAKKQPASISGGVANPLPSSNSKQFQDQVSKLRKSNHSEIKNRMGYSARNGSLRLVPEETFKKASSGPMQLKFVPSNDEVAMVYRGGFPKSSMVRCNCRAHQGLDICGFEIQKKSHDLRRDYNKIHLINDSTYYRVDDLHPDENFLLFCHIPV